MDFACYLLVRRLQSTYFDTDSISNIDGGGVRGLSTLYILQGLMKKINLERAKEKLPAVKPCEVFDLIGGTSTGG
jgi:patatin-like phospholipase/acyl hydrolase